jgi:hypothetical protein
MSSLIISHVHLHPYQFLLIKCFGTDIFTDLQFLNIVVFLIKPKVLNPHPVYVLWFYCTHLKKKIIWFFRSLTLKVLDKGYSRNASCAHNLISTFLLQLLTNVIVIQTKVLPPQAYMPMAELDCSVLVLWSYCANRLFNYLAFQSFNGGCTR